MPTRNRPRFVELAVACWLTQDYPDKELVIVDDGDPVGPLVSGMDRVTYVHLGDTNQRTIGEKRNYCCQVARGEVIVHWDDDDWSGPQRLTEQVKLLRQTGRPATGYNTLPFAWDDLRRAWMYLGVKGYALGTSLCYRRAYWAGHRFEPVHIGEDGRFVAGLGDRIITEAGCGIVARVHDGSTSNSKNEALLLGKWTGGPGEMWQEIDYAGLAVSGYPVVNHECKAGTGQDHEQLEDGDIRGLQDRGSLLVPMAQQGASDGRPTDAPGGVRPGDGDGGRDTRPILHGGRKRRN